MEKKKVIIFVILLIITSYAFADKYKVLYVNSSNIKIGNKTIVSGQIFDDKENITWSSDQQAMKVLNLNTKRVMVFAAKALNKKKAASLYDYLTSTKHLSTRNINQNRIEEWQMDTTLYMLDTLYISMPPRHNQNITTKIVHKYGKEIPIQSNGGYYIITRNLFDQQERQPIVIDIVEYDKSNDWTYIVFKNLNIEFVQSIAK